MSNNVAPHDRDSQPFRFMDLPPELRLMVYERLPRTAKHSYIRNIREVAADTSSFDLILVSRHVPLSILGTCRAVQEEAEPIVKRIVTNFILKYTPKVIEDFTRCEPMALLSYFIQYAYAPPLTILQQPSLAARRAYETISDIDRLAMWRFAVQVARTYATLPPGAELPVAVVSRKPPRWQTYRRRMCIDGTLIHQAGLDNAIAAAAAGSGIDVRLDFVGTQYVDEESFGAFDDEMIPVENWESTPAARMIEELQPVMTREVWVDEWIPS